MTNFRFAKGGVDKGENAQATALREGEEELGIKKKYLKFIKKLGAFVVKKKNSTNVLYVYFAFYAKPFDLNPHDFEVKKVKWLTLEQFKQQGRRTQLSIIEKAEKLINEFKRNI